MADPTMTIDEAVRNAVQGTPPENTDPPPAGDPPPDENKPPKEEPPKPPVVDEKTSAAIRLFDNLNDPSVSAGVIEELARRAGLQVTKTTTPEKATESLIDRLKKNTPENLHFILESLAPALTDLVNEQIKEGIKPIQAEQISAREAQAKKEVDSVWDKMKTDHKDFEQVEESMLELAKDMPMRPGSDLLKYTQNLYKLATADKRETQKIVNKNERIVENQKNGPQVKSAETAEFTVTKGSKFPSLDEAVRSAFNKTRLEP